MFNKTCTWTAKTRAIPSLHRDNFSAKEPGLCPVLASGNTTSLYRRAVRRHSTLKYKQLPLNKMKSLNQVYLTICISILIFLSACIRNKEAPNTKSPSVDTSMYTLKAVFKGNYNNFYDSLDKKCYFIVETQLTNNSDKVLEFVITSCSTVINMVSDSKQIDFLLPRCAGHYHIIIKLKPKQIYSTSFIVYTHLDEDLKVKFGFILITPKMFQESHFNTLYEKQRKIIWSNPITLDEFSTHDFKIMQIVNDTTYSDIKYYNSEEIIE
jgi:hypothetical protein